MEIDNNEELKKDIISSDEDKLSIKDEFELREKRLKLVYRILYVAAALWAATIVAIVQPGVTAQVAPFYTFLLSSTSVVIIRIIKYALLELRCMRIKRTPNDSTEDEAEIKYGYIWSFFGMSLAFLGILLYVNIKWRSLFEMPLLMFAFGLSIAGYIAITVIDVVYLVKKKPLKGNKQRILDLIGMFVGNLLSYSICSICLLAVTGNA